MLTVLMALAMAVLDKPTNRSESYEVPIPLMWDDRQPEVFVVNLKPTWKVGQVTSASNDSLNQSDESNLEHWRNQFELKNDVDELAPHTAIEKDKPCSGIVVSARIVSEADILNYHSPWQLAIQRNWPAFFRNNVLVYELTKVPTSQKPYYEAFVCCMPNIRCKAKTIEALQEQLLHQYSEYLAKMLQDEEDFPTRQPNIRSNHEWLNGSFIAWLIGATNERDKKKPEITQILSFTTKVKY